MCRKQCFESNFSTAEELDAHFQEMEKRFMREMAGATPWNAQIGFF
jgi:hypothetical protein